MGVGSTEFGCALTSTGAPSGPGRLCRVRYKKVKKPWELFSISLITVLGATVSSQTESRQGCVCSMEKRLVRMASARHCEDGLRPGTP